MTDDMRDRLGRVLADRYSIQGEAGSGGMARVFRALDLKHQRTVAIKVLRPEVAAAIGRERFLREIEISANLSHPHIVPVHESGEADGFLYYIMPFVEGQTLRERLSEDPPLELDQVLELVRQVCRALEFAHEQGIVHRDLKPENIMLSAGIAVVTDFGVARAISTAEGHDLTSIGVAIGTPRYMSPEQADGLTVDGRSDLYSLACIVFEMLTGETPFDAPTPIAMLTKHATTLPPDVREVRGDVPASVAQAIDIALRKDPDERFSTATEFVTALETGRIPPGLRLRRRASRVRAIRLTAAGLAVALAAWLGRGLFRGAPALDESGPPTVAVLGFEQLGTADDPYFSEGMTDEVSSRIASVRGIGVIAHSSAMQYDRRDHSLEEIGRELGARYLVEGTIRTDRRPDGTGLVRVTPSLVRVSDGRTIWSKPFDAELTPGGVFDVQSQIASSVAEALNVTLLPGTQERLEARPTSSLEAYDSYMRGNLYASQFLVREEQDQAIAMYERAVELDPDFGLAYAQLAQAHALYFNLFDPTPARITKILDAVSHAEALAPDEPETQVARGFARFFSGGGVDEALREFRGAADRLPSNSKIRWVIGTLLRSQGDLEGALSRFTEASLIDPRSHFYVFEIVTALLMLQRFDEATQYADRLRVIAPEWVAGWVAKAPIYLYQGDVEAARQVMTDVSLQAGALDRLVPHLIEDALYRPEWEMVVPESFHDKVMGLTLQTAAVDSADYYLAKARTFRVRGDRPRQVAYLDSLVSVLELRIESMPTLTLSRLDLGSAYAALGRTEDARAQAAVLDGLRLSERDRFRGFFAAMDLARLHAAIGDADAAISGLQTLAQLPSPLTGAFLAADPAFVSLHGDPRFQAIVDGL